VKLRRRQWLQLAAGAATLLIFSVGLPVHGAWSQATSTIRVIVPFPPGGTMDILARVLTEQIGRAQGQTMVVENRPGGGSVIGTEAAARAAPDGNTVLMLANSFVINPHLKKLSYDPLTSFEPICYLVRTPNVLAVNTSSPHRTLGDFLDAARMKPGDLTLASVGPGTTQHIAIEVFKRAANVNMTYVPYPGDAPAVNALLGGHVASILATNTAVSGHVQAGRLRVLAVASRGRVESLPDLPTVAESGFKDYEADAWFGLVAPAKTPKDVVSQLAGWFSAAIRVPEVKTKLAAQGLLPVGTCGEDFAVHLRRQYDEYGRVIREAGIKAE
jgi:tripartite-type tricarboxylate transporter receptor subunit TctC